jgi:hypothetical protein
MSRNNNITSLKNDSLTWLNPLKRPKSSGEWGGYEKNVIR